jgi:hypothetical protein
VGSGDRISVSHLNAVFGAVEINAEILDLIDVPAYRAAWLEYCRYYNAPEDEIRARFNEPPRGRNLIEGHSRLTAYAAVQEKDPALAQRAWKEFYSGQSGLGMLDPLQSRVIKPPEAPRLIIEDPRISTNAASQWGLAAIQNLALIGYALPRA